MRLGYLMPVQAQKDQLGAGDFRSNWTPKLDPVLTRQVWTERAPLIRATGRDIIKEPVRHH
jgi:hypothetical protein